MHICCSCWFLLLKGDKSINITYAGWDSVRPVTSSQCDAVSVALWVKLLSVSQAAFLSKPVQFILSSSGHVFLHTVGGWGWSKEVVLAHHLDWVSDKEQSVYTSSLSLVFLVTLCKLLWIFFSSLMGFYISLFHLHSYHFWDKNNNIIHLWDVYCPSHLLVTC